MGCALVCDASHAAPSSNGAAQKEQTPAHPVPLEQAKPLPMPRPVSGVAIIGEPANPRKVSPVITGAVNPAKNTAAVSGTGMKRKP